MDHPYTTESLRAGAPSFVVRVPGAREVARMFPEPSSVGRGSLWVEGGITLVGGPGMGKTTLLRELARFLEAERGIPTALVALPPVEGYPGERGFQRYLAAAVQGCLAELRRSAALAPPGMAAVREALGEPAWDGAGPEPALTPRGLEGWVTRLGAAAARSGGLCLLLDDVDRPFSAGWKVAFVSALRFAFQTSTGLTPIYGAWKAFLDESLPGSNYFRNVTRPVFLEPLAAWPREEGEVPERRALVDRALSGLPAPATERLYQLAGGHPRLLQRVLADLCERLEPGAAAGLRGPAVEAMLGGEAAGRERALAAELLSGSAELAATLRELSGREGSYPYQNLSKVIVASGLVDRDEQGRARVPERARDVL